MRRSNALAWIGFAGIAGTTLAGACAASSQGAGFGSGGVGGSGGGQNLGGQSSNANSTSAFTSSGAFMSTGATSDASPDVMACAADKVKAEQLPLDIFIMLDQSTSMTDIVANNQTKWQAVTAAITGFVQQPSAMGIEVGIQYFALAPGGISCGPYCLNDLGCVAPLTCVFDVCGGCTDSCAAADYSIPDVGIAPLPGVSSAIVASLGKHFPITGTPTSAALEGAIDYSQAWATLHPMHTVITILATDGNPEECDTDLGDIDAIAAAGLAATPKIQTFVIGVGDSLTALDGIAQAGGTGQALIVDTAQDVNQQFLDALNKIRGAALACQYTIPLPEAGMPDYDKVNVQYTPGMGSMTPQILPKVGDEADCPANGFAWYYNDAAAPTEIIMCDATCTALTKDSTGEVDVLTGCQTILK